MSTKDTIRDLHVALPAPFRWGATLTAGTGPCAALAADLGLDTVRFALRWSDLAGEDPRRPLATVRSELAALRERGLAIELALPGHDLPASLAEAGGWTERSSAERYADYAAGLARGLADLVERWIVLPEPVALARRPEAAATLRAAHHVNLAHGMAARAIRAEVSDEARVGFSLDLAVLDPADETSSADHLAAERAQLVANKIVLGPLLDATYPIELIEGTRHLTDWSFVHAGDLHTARVRVDELGVSYHPPRTVRAVPDAPAPAGWPGCEGLELGAPAADDRALSARGLYDIVTALDTAYEGSDLSVVCAPARLAPSAEDAPHERLVDLREHLSELHAAVADGAQVVACILDSLCDGSLASVDGSEVRLTEAGFWFRDLLANQRERRAADPAQRRPAETKDRRRSLRRLLRRR
ncbi:MAG: family 1 glycosylhydrolase [Bowdeniella nasicola]|nr:family 1 glycosylhydrolase [Bowdeniella nasicola]